MSYATRWALHYLSGKKVSLNETAYLVGFSEPAAFSRASSVGPDPACVCRSRLVYRQPNALERSCRDHVRGLLTFRSA